MTESASIDAQKLNQVLRTVKIMSVGLVLFGLALSFNFAGLAVMLNLHEMELHKTVGLMAIVLGIIDYYLIPRMIMKRLHK